MTQTFTTPSSSHAREVDACDDVARDVDACDDVAERFLLTLCLGVLVSEL